MTLGLRQREALRVARRSAEGEGMAERLQATVQGGANGAQLGRPSGEETELE